MNDAGKVYGAGISERSELPFKLIGNSGRVFQELSNSRYEKLDNVVIERNVNNSLLSNAEMFTASSVGFGYRSE